jgi:hypothetical protein
LDAETGGQKLALETADVHRDRKSGDDTGEIPAETASLESPTKCAVWEDWMVVCAVRYEPVSARWALISGLLQRIFADRGLFREFGPYFGSDDQRLRGKIPRSRTGRFFQLSGHRRAVTANFCKRAGSRNYRRKPCSCSIPTIRMMGGLLCVWSTIAAQMPRARSKRGQARGNVMFRGAGPGVGLAGNFAR